MYPESPTPIYPLILEPIWKTLRQDFDSGAEQRRQKWLFPKYDVTVAYKGLTVTEAQIIYDFYMACKGSYTAFNIYDLSLLANIYPSHTGQYVGTGDGIIDTFDLPGRSTSSQTIYIDAVEQVSGFSYSYGTGTDSADQVVFSSPPTTGQVITVDFTGVLRIRARFAEDKLSRDLFVTNLIQFQSIQLKGLAAI